MYEACDSIQISASISVYKLITAHAIYLYMMYFWRFNNIIAE